MGNNVLMAISNIFVSIATPLDLFKVLFLLGMPSGIPIMLLQNI